MNHTHGCQKKSILPPALATVRALAAADLSPGRRAAAEAAADRRRRVRAMVDRECRRARLAAEEATATARSIDADEFHKRIEEDRRRLARLAAGPTVAELARMFEVRP